MARTKTTSNPPPLVNYKALYHWALKALLLRPLRWTAMKTLIHINKANPRRNFMSSGKSLTYTWRSSLAGKGSLCALMIGWIPTSLSSSCTPQFSSSSNSTFLSRGLSALYLLRSTWSRPNCMPTVGRLCEPSRSSATTWGILLPSMSSSIFSRPRTWERSYGWASTGWRGGPSWPFSSIQEEVLEDLL